jgi:hypothetical protein
VLLRIVDVQSGAVSGTRGKIFGMGGWIFLQLTHPGSGLSLVGKSPVAYDHGRRGWVCQLTCCCARQSLLILLQMLQ